MGVKEVVVVQRIGLNTILTMIVYLGAKMNQNKNNQPLPSNAKDRKERPMYRGLLAYFPDALAAIANVSHVGNEQHNPGEKMHWARDKSKDHADCIMRHLTEQGSMDDDGLRHSAKMAWRALALLQIEIEQGPLDKQLDRLNGFTTRTAPQTGVSKDGLARPQYEYPQLVNDCRVLPQDSVDEFDLKGGFLAQKETIPRVYIAGPMRGIPEFNFPAFDKARDLAVTTGWTPVSPADIDRLCGVNEDTNPEDVNSFNACRTFAERDCLAIIGLKGERGDAIAMLPDWTNSTGARAEFFLADWVGLKVLNALTMEPFTIQEQNELWNEFNHKGLAELRASALRIIGKGE